MSRIIIYLILTVFASGCSDKKDSEMSNSDEQNPDKEWYSDFPEANQIFIKKALANDGVVVGKLDELLKAVKASTSRAEIEKRFGMPDDIRDGIVTYLDEEWSRIPIYSNLKGLTSVSIRYDDNNKATLFSTGMK